MKQKKHLDFRTLLLGIAVMLLMAMGFSSCRASFGNSYDRNHGCPILRSGNSYSVGTH